MRPKLSFWKQIRLLKKEIAEVQRFFGGTSSETRKLLFYSAQTQYFAYFSGMIDALISRNIQVAYITSDFDDPILTESLPNVTAFYFNKLFPFVAPFLDSKVIVMTMPDLHLLHIRRSIFDSHYIFVFHSMCSSHMGLNKEALNHFDTIFCNGPYHFEEITKAESIYNLKPKSLFEAGYFRLERLYKEHKIWREKKKVPSTPLIVVAPSWQKDNILEACGKELVSVLLSAKFNVVVRPHPMTTYRRPETLYDLETLYGKFENFKLDIKTESNYYLHEAALLICDWSGVSMEYAFATERPVLYLDLPPKIHNPDYQELDIVPMEMGIRSKIGKIIQLTEVKNVAQHVQEMLTNKDLYRQQIIAARNESLYHFGQSSERSADYIEQLLAISNK